MDFESKKYVHSTAFVADEKNGQPAATMVITLNIPAKPGSTIWKDAFLEAESLVQSHALLHPNARVKFVNMSGQEIAP